MELWNINIDERMAHYNVTGLSMALVNHGQMTTTESFGILEAGTNKKVSHH